MKKGILNILKQIKALEARLYVSDGKLKLDLPKGVILPSDLKAAIGRNKEKIISFLGTENNVSYSPIKVLPQQLNYELSSSQRRLYILNQFDQDSGSYNMPGEISISGDQDVECFKRALNSIIERHEILRTVFRENEDGEVMQFIFSPNDLPFKLIEKDYRNAHDSIGEAQSFIDQDRFISFDLSSGPLLRAALLQVANDHYIFYYNMHHIISDGWSMEVLIKDVLFFYEAYRNGEEQKLSELRIQYKDYAAWQQEQLTSSALEKSKTYWKTHLDGELPILNLPTTKLRPKIKTYSGRTLSTYVHETTSQALKSFCQERNGSLFMGLLTVWKVLCYRYTNQREILTGSPVAGREHADLNDQIGFYINTLPFKATIDPDENFEQTFDRIKEMTLQGQSHQMYPFDKIIEDLEIAIDPSRSAVFDVILALENKTENSDTNNAYRSGIINDLGSSIAKFDLDIIFEEIGDRILCRIGYNIDVYDQPMVEQLLMHYQQLLEQLIYHSTKKIGGLDFLTNRELQVLQSFNDTAVVETNATIVDSFQVIARRQPDHPAIVFNETILSYKELDEMSNQLAHFLMSKEVKPEELIVVQLERSALLIVAILGILKAGCAYVPIDPSYPKERIDFILKESKSEICIDAQFVEAFQKQINAVSKQVLDLKIAPESLGYVIYTSGSTGVPKGVMIEQKSIVNLSEWHKKTYNVSNKSRSTLIANVGFDASPWEIFPYLLSGATIYPLNDEQRLDSVQLLELCNENEISHVFMPTALYKSFEGAFNSPKYHLNLLVGGEELDEKYAIERITLFNNYGPTENTVVATAHMVRDNHQKGCIGKPIENVQVKIIDEQGEICPIGVVGEICIEGSGLARGYWQDPELTAQKFTGSGANRRYHTGDLGHWEISGDVIYKGRKDNQVKIRGNRLELGEIEHKLKAVHTINDAIVVLNTKSTREKNLIAYFTASEEFDLADLKMTLRKELPDYMVPNHFIELAKIPLTANQKVDKKRLPLPDDAAGHSSHSYVPPSNEMEQQLTAIFAEELNTDVSKIGVHDNFFDLGLNSLKMIGLVKKIDEKIGIKMQLVSFFQYRNIQELSAFLIGEDEELHEEEEIVEDIDDFIDMMDL